MLYPFIKQEDETEVSFSNIRKKENGEEYLIVCFERPTEQGLDTFIIELPSYDIVLKEGNFTRKEISEFKQIVHRGAHLFFRWAKEGGIKIA